jgi:hypothetical protein
MVQQIQRLRLLLNEFVNCTVPVKIHPHPEHSGQIKFDICPLK